MRSSCFLIILAILMLGSCGERKSDPAVSGPFSPETQVTLEGEVRGGSGLEILIEELGARAFIPIDTVSCNEQGAFTSSWESSMTAFYVVRFGQNAYHTLLLEPGEKVRYRASADSTENYQVSGSEGSALLAELNLRHRQAIAELEAVGLQKQEAVAANRYSAMAGAADLRFDSIRRDFRHWSEDFIRQNASSPAILVALYNLYGQHLPVFDPASDMEIYHFVDSSLMLHHPEMEAVQMLHTQLQQFRNEDLEPASAPGMEPGSLAPDFVSETPEGSSLALSDLRGNYVLLNFWASWSPHCMEENQILLTAWKQYASQGLKILQVSLDEDAAAWRAAIAAAVAAAPPSGSASPGTQTEVQSAVQADNRADTPEGWWHVSDLRRWETPVVGLYRIERIPQSFLIGPDGKIMEAGLNGKELLTKLESLKSE